MNGVEILGIDSRWLYAILVLMVACERGIELLVSRRNIRRILARGGVEVGAADYKAMVVLHASFLLACPAEVFLLGRPLLPVWAVCMSALLAGTMALRYWVVATLGDRWNTRVVYVPGEPPLSGGPYRFLRHPNYLAVTLEIVALPMIHTAWITAIVFSIGNAFVLQARLRTENAALYGPGIPDSTR